MLLLFFFFLARWNSFPLSGLYSLVACRIFISQLSQINSIVHDWRFWSLASGINMELYSYFLKCHIQMYYSFLLNTQFLHFHFSELVTQPVFNSVSASWSQQFSLVSHTLQHNTNFSLKSHLGFVQWFLYKKTSVVMQSYPCLLFGILTPFCTSLELFQCCL